MSRCEIIVIDDSDDGTAEAIRGRFGGRLKIIKNSESLGSPRCRNLGLEEAKHDVVLMLDDDVEIKGDAVSYALTIWDYATVKAGIVGSRIIDMVSPKFNHRMLGKLAWWMAGQIFPPTDGESRYVDFVSGAGMAVNKRNVDTRFDPNFGGNAFNEESDFQLRARREGARVYYAADLPLIHHEIGSGGQSDHEKNLTRREWMLKNHRYFLKKNFRHSWRIRNLFYRLYVFVIWNLF